VTQPRWLLLAHQLPTRPSNARVKTWRRLQQVGAVPSRNSVYVLPNSDQCREDFEWLRGEIVALGGDALVFAADALSPGGSEDLVASFQRARDADYRALKRDADKMLASARAKAAATAGGRDAWGRRARALRERLAEIERIDFFHAPARHETETSLAALERISRGERARAPQTVAPLAVADFSRRRWVTRPRPGVDRMASAWLIRRYIDPKATFAFVERPADADVPFDMYVGDFSHQGSLCTFEILARRFDLTDPAVVRIGQIVHDLDTKESKYAPVEAPAVGRMIEGLQRLHADDHTLLQHGMAMFDALASSFSATAPTKRRAHVRRPPEKRRGRSRGR
jgi:hypothetical protein